MPRSRVLYLSKEAFSALTAGLREAFSERAIKPYTLSFGNPSADGSLRTRLTELEEGSCEPLVADLAASWPVTVASSSDPEVMAASYQELFEASDRYERRARLRFVSPTVTSLGGYPVPFPVLPILFSLYIHVWNSFAAIPISKAASLFQHIKMTDFKVSCAKTDLGPGFEGWADLELERGIPESEIGLFNTLCDFSFYSSSGVHTEDGFGQTRRGGKSGREG